MKVAVIGSRSISATDIGMYISNGDEIVSGGAVGIDSCAAEYAKKKRVKVDGLFASIRAVRSCRANREKQNNSGLC